MDKQAREGLTLEGIELFFIWQKASRVLTSCRTDEQLKSARRYIELAGLRQAEYQRKVRKVRGMVPKHK